MQPVASHRTGLLARLALLVAVTLLCLVALEVLVRLFIPVRNVGASFTEYDAYFGKALKPSFETVRITPEFEMTFTTNANRRRGTEMDPPRGGVLFIGDSFTMGYGVDDGREFPALVGKQLEAKLGHPVSTVNIGMGNNGNGRWIRFLERDAEAIAPRVVVMQVCDNDYLDNLTEGLYSLDDQGALVRHEVPAPGFSRKAQQIVEALPFVADSYLMGLAQQLALPRPPEPVPGAQTATTTAAPTDVITYRLIERAIEICEERGWPVLGVTAHVEGERRERLQRLFERHGVDVIHVPLREERPDLYFEVDAHWNEAGQAYVAEKVTSWLAAHRELLE